MKIRYAFVRKSIKVHVLYHEMYTNIVHQFILFSETNRSHFFSICLLSHPLESSRHQGWFCFKWLRAQFPTI